MEYFKRRYLINGPIGTVFLFIYNYFLIDILFRYIDYQLNPVVLLSICLFLALVNIISITVEMNASHKITRIFMEISELWKWASLMFLFELILLYVLGLFIKIPRELVLILYSLVIVLGVYGYYNAHHIKVKYHNLPILKGDDNESIAILHISDVHFGSIRRESILVNLKNKINQVYLDLKQEGIEHIIVIISGDLVDGSSPVNIEDLKPLKDIKPKVIYTPGNHDHYQDINGLLNDLEELGVIVLNGDSLDMKDLGLNIIGLDFKYEDMEGKWEECHFNLPVNKSETNILIFHLPIFYEYFKKLGVDLQLSGHTHGGQFYPANLWVKAVYHKLKGLYAFSNYDVSDGFYLSVSTGLGTMGPPIRIGTDSEIVVLMLNNKNFKNSFF